MKGITVRAARPTDGPVWLSLRNALWPEGVGAEHRAEIEEYFRGEFPRWPWKGLLAEDGEGEVLGFAEVSIRPYAEGCLSSRVAYLEGWFVAKSARRQGVGWALVTAAEDWGRSRGCTEFASDTDLDNEVSTAAHLALGFVDEGLVRCFSKKL